MSSYFWVALGSALGGLARYALTKWTLPWSEAMPWGTVLINVIGCFIIGFFGTYTLASGRHATAESMRLFVMVGICGGFTTFSSYSLQTFDLLREGAWGRALLNVMLSVTLCLVAVGAGHLAAQTAVARIAIAQTDTEEGMEPTST